MHRSDVAGTDTAAPEQAHPSIDVDDVEVADSSGGTARIWSEFKATGSRQLRDQLIVHYSPLVKYVAARVAVGLPRYVDQADLVSYGVIGLIDAIDKFDPQRHVKFETYAIQRIKGAILDELRSIDWVPRTVRSKARAIEEAYAKLETALLRTPTDAEVAAELDMTDEEFNQALSQVSFLGVAALDEVLGTPGDRAEPVTLGDTIPDSGANPGAALEVKEARRLLAEAIGRLAERERAILTFYYYEGLTLAEIGEIFGISESRVCQIHTKAVLQLRSRMSMRRRDGSDLKTDLAGN